MEPPVSDEHGGTVTMGGERQGEEEIPCAHRIIPTGDSCQSASAKVPGLLRAGRSGHGNNPRIGVIPVIPRSESLVFVGGPRAVRAHRQPVGRGAEVRAMSTLAPLLQAFFSERLIGQREASPHTVASYRDAICLLLRFAQHRTGKAPHQLDLDDLDAPLIGAFLNYLEVERGASARTRNARLTAIRSLFGFAAYHHPEHAAVIQRVLAIPPNRTARPSSGDAITCCCCSPWRPGCVSPSSPH